MILALLLAASAPAERAVSLLQYIAGDYTVSDSQEYEEQKVFAAEIVSLIGTDGSSLQSLIARKAAPEAVTFEARRLASIVEARYGLRLLPPRPPRPAQSLYRQACAACHDAGHVELSTHPADFTQPAEVSTLSPQRAYLAVTHGVPGTAMPAFDDALTQEQRWDLAYYVLSLSHRAGLSHGRELLSRFPRRPDYLQLATRTDAQLRALLAGSGLSPADREAILSACRN